jgi:hypothetical protein
MTVGGLFCCCNELAQRRRGSLRYGRPRSFFHGDSGHPHFGHVGVPGEQEHLNITAALRLSLQAAI